MPVACMVFVMTPKDHFEEFNAWPEHMRRVSVLQYEKINLNRFRSNSEIK